MAKLFCNHTTLHVSVLELVAYVCLWLACPTTMRLQYAWFRQHASSAQGEGQRVLDGQPCRSIHMDNSTSESLQKDCPEEARLKARANSLGPHYQRHG